MPTSPPTVAELADNEVASIESALGQSVPLLAKAFIRVMSKAHAGVFILLYKYAGWTAQQMFVRYASASDTVINGRIVNPLTELGRLVGVGDPIAATRAEHTVTVTVKVQTGSLPAGSQLLYAATGVLYLTTAAVELNAATVTATIRASSDQAGGGGVGSIGNLETGDIVAFANPLPNVATNAVILARTVDGADAETPDAYRARITRRFQRKPQGGAYADYELWATSVAGIVNAYPYTSATPGEVDVYVEATEESSGSEDGIPTGAQLLAVAAYIEGDDDGLASLRPANAAVNVLAITRKSFDVTVTGLEAADVDAAEEAIETAVDEYLRTREPFIVGLHSLPRLDRVTLSAVAGVVDEAANAAGATVTTVELEVSSVPITALTLANGERAKLGAMTFA